MFAIFNDLKIQDYYVEHGIDFIMLVTPVTGLIHSRLNEAVKATKKSSISTYDILIKAGHLRMVNDGANGLNLRNTRKKDLELLKQLCYVPEGTYVEQNYPINFLAV